MKEDALRTRVRLDTKQRAEIKKMFDGCCAYCGDGLGDRWHVDHVDPVLRETKYIKGKGFVLTGKMYFEHRDSIKNMMPACPPCNIDKGGSTLEAWRERLTEIHGVLRRNYPTYRHALRFGLVAETLEPVVFYFERLRGKSE